MMGLGNLQTTRVPNAMRVIAGDLKRFGWMWTLSGICLASAMAIVVTTQNTRMLIAQHAQLVERKNNLNSDWRHLLIEENALNEHNRIEQLAKQRLHMIHPQPDDEILVNQP